MARRESPRQSASSSTPGQFHPAPCAGTLVIDGLNIHRPNHAIGERNADPLAFIRIERRSDFVRGHFAHEFMCGRFAELPDWYDGIAFSSVGIRQIASNSR
jgi:hypothetical protein